MANRKKRIVKPETLALAEQQPGAAAEAPPETEPGFPSVGIGAPQAGQALRRRAEEMALAKVAQLPEGPEALSPKEVRRLLHELRVHQIELEMQNEELLRAQEEVGASRARYSDLYDLAPVGYFTLSAEGLILQANLTAATLFGMARDALARQPLTRFILHEDQDIYYLHRKRLFETCAPQVCELRMLRANGDQFWARLEATAGQEADGASVCRIVVSDVTERKRAEETLRASEDKYRLLIENTHDIVYTCGLDGVFTFVSPSWTAHLGHAVDQVIGKSFQQFVHPDDITASEALLNQMAMAGERQSGIEYRVRHADGSWRWHNSNVVPVRDESGALVGFEGIASDITERVRAAQAVRENQAHLSALIENTEDWIWAVDADCRFIIGNTRFTKGVEEGQGRTITMGESALLDGVPQKTQDEWRGYYDRALRGEPFSVEIQTSFFGEPACIDFRFHPIREADGTIGGVVVSGREVTARKQAEEALRESERKFHGFVSLSEDAIVLTDEQGFVTEWNRGAEMLYGLKAQEALGQPLWDLQYRAACDENRTPELREQMKAGIQAGYLGGREAMPNRLLDMTIQRPDGTRRDVQTMATSMHTERGIILGSITRDVSETKQAERRLRDSEERFRQLVEHAPEAVMVHGGGRFLYLNPAAVRLYGAESADQLVGTPVMDRVDPRFHDLVRERLLRLDAEKVALPLIEEGFLRMDGSPLPVEVATVPIQWDGQTVALVLARDLTELKRATQERLDMERRLLHGQKLESLGVLAGGIAHDFNNLLMALLGNLELATEDLSPVSSARPRVEQAVLAAKRAADLTRQMLAYSGKGHFDVRPIDLSELVEENAHMLRAAVPRSVTFNLHLSKDLPPILADAGQIQQVVMNLITNASEAIGESPGIVALGTGAQVCDASYLSRSLLGDKPAPGEFVWLDVTDTGCGMSAETLQRMFEPFFTTKFTGRGLGMAAVHGIVRGHLGAVLAETAVGEGTTIRVLFPAAERTAKPSIQAAVVGGEPAPEATAPLLSGTVLVVDDEPMVRELCAATLTGLGLQVLVAADGAEAMAKLREHSDEIACVLLDLTMPGMDGAATFEAMRILKPDVRVILWSGYDEEEATQRFAGRGLAGFLQKPFQLKDLRAELVRVLKAT